VVETISTFGLSFLFCGARWARWLKVVVVLSDSLGQGACFAPNIRGSRTKRNEADVMCFVG
jgi:hypothetical protein